MPPKKQKQLPDGVEEVPYAWELIDDIYVPVIFRQKTKYVPVRVVELKLLTRYPHNIPAELKKVQKCRSYYINEQEVKVLNEINLKQCKSEYGTESFNENDVVVELDEFRKFFDLVTDTVISRAAIDMGFTNGGWLQVNNTVCPYVWIANVRHVPFEVISLAAELVGDDDSVKKVLVTDKQLKFLNKLCSKSNRTFSFDDNTELISLLWLKLNAEPVILELPPDSPFDHATFIDIQSSNESIQRIKSTAKEALNAFYNHSIVERYKNPDIDRDEAGTPVAEESPKSPDLDAESIDDEGETEEPKETADEVRGVEPLEQEDTTTSDVKITPNTSTSEQSEEERCISAGSVRSDNSEHLKAILDQPPSKDKNLETNNTQAALTSQTEKPFRSQASSNKTKSTIKEERSNVKQSTTPGGTRTKSPAYPPPPPDPMENRYAPTGTMMERYQIHSINSESRYFTASLSMVREISQIEPALAVLLKAIPSASTKLDMAALQLISRCINIQAKVLNLFSRAFGEMKEQEPYRTGLERDYLLEAMAVVQDATRNFAFWNASAHKVSLGGAERINNSLVTAVLSDHPYSFLRSPDIVHFMVSGVFGARTLPGAKNFRFLQDVMSIAFIAAGMTDLNPMVSYAIVCNTFDELVCSLMNWCQVVSISPEHLEMMDFVTLTYKLYENVYADVKFTPRDMRLPAPAMRPGRTQQHQTSVAPKLVSQPSTKTMQQAAQMGHQSPPNFFPATHSLNYGQPIMSVGMPPLSRAPQFQLMPRLGVPQSIAPASSAGFQSSLPPQVPTGHPPPPPYPQGMPHLQPAIPVVNSPTPGILTPEPYSRPGSSASGADSDLRISSVTSLGGPSSQLLLPAPPTKVNLATVKSVCTVPPTQLDTKTDLADAITLVRAHGKKIPVYKKGQESWVLCEDVQKTYFPRIQMMSFFKELKELKPVVISFEVNEAFRHHYDMTDVENFELPFMMAFGSIKTTLNLLSAAGTKRPCDQENTNPAKKPTGVL